MRAGGGVAGVLGVVGGRVASERVAGELATSMAASFSISRMEDIVRLYRSGDRHVRFWWQSTVYSSSVLDWWS